MPPSTDFSILPPPVDYVLDKDRFNKVVDCTALRMPARLLGEYLPVLRAFMINTTYPRLKPVIQCPDDPSQKLLVLATDLAGLPGDDDNNDNVDDNGGGVEQKTVNRRSHHRPQSNIRGRIQAAIDKGEVSVRSYPYTMTYDHLSSDTILTEILPRGSEVPSAFETIGHIAHLNIKHELMPWRFIIGQVILDKNPAIKTVLTKVGSIGNEFRVFDHLVLAGDPSLETQVAQGRLRFRLNFGEVYWNSRLEGEHNRLTEKYFRSPQGQVVVCDMMCGIGPFALRAAQSGCDVYANDLNPRSIHWLNINVQKNAKGGRLQGKVHTFNMCGRAFVRRLAGGDRTRLDQDGGGGGGGGGGDDSAGTSREGMGGFPEHGVYFDHIVMNLPASAVEFVDAFRGCFPEEVYGGRMPLVHLYTFLRGTEEEAIRDARGHVESHLGDVLEEEPEVHVVRLVAPMKHMLCITFRIPERVGLIPTSRTSGRIKRKAEEEPGN